MKKVYDRIIDMLKNIWESITKAFKWIKDKFTNKIEQIKKVAEPKSDYPDLYDVTKVAKVCSGIINGVAAWSNGIVGVTNKYFKDDSFKESFDKEYLADRKDSLLRLSFTCTKVVPYPGFVEATSMQDYKQLVKDRVLDEKNKGPVGDILRHMTKALDFGSNMAKETAHALTEFKMNATKCKNNSMLIKDTNGKTVNTMACAVFSACGTIVNAIYEAVTVVLNQYLNLKI